MKRLAFTMARCAFTMAEILLSLTIIGVVAAITLPSLTGNINERTWNTQRKAIYARFSQAISLMPAINGYGVVREASGTEGTESYVAGEDTAAETFITAGLSKVMKINNICSDNITDCGFPENITTMAAESLATPLTLSALNAGLVASKSTEFETFDIPDSKVAAFETGNGESVLVYYNNKCVGSLGENGAGGNAANYIAPKFCANFIYDLNGTKGPNTVGKDIGFMSIFFPSDGKIVAPVPANSPLSGTYKIKAEDGEVNAVRACTNFDSEYRLPNLEELMAIGVNKNLLGTTSSGSMINGTFWSSTKITSMENWTVDNGNLYDNNQVVVAKKVWCVKR